MQSFALLPTPLASPTKRLPAWLTARRSSVLWGLTTVTAAATLVVVTLAARGGPVPTAPTQQLTMTEGTNIALAVSPDQKTILMDLQGGLWSLPAGGGAATLLTDPLLEPARPDWSPRGDLVAFQAYAGGTFHIWMMRPDGSEVRQITFGHGDDREPRFSPDGTKIAFASDRAFNNTYDIWVVDLANGQALTQWTAGVVAPGTGDEFEPAWTPDGSEIAFVSGAGSTGTRIEAANAAGVRRTLVTAPAGARLNSPSFSPDGTRVAYLQFANNHSQLLVSGTPVGTSTDAFPFFPRWLSNDRILYGADGKIRVSNVSDGATSEIPFQAQFALAEPAFPYKSFDFDARDARPAKGIVSPVLSPNGKRVVFQALNQLWLLRVGEATPRQLTTDSYYKSDPVWSPDGRRIAYACDRAGTMNLYVREITTGVEERVTTMTTSAQVSPAWSPDGTRLAFQNQAGATFTLELATGNVRQVIAPLFAPSRPSWSADGATIAVAALKPYTRRFREGNSQMLTVDVSSGNLIYSELVPFKSPSTRGDDGPVYSPDGSAVAFVMDSQLWVRPVDGNGLPTGDARRINSEVTDAPSWSGDSQQLLYLSNGQLRLVSRDGGTPRDVPLDLPVARQAAEGKTVIHAGRLWDGLGPDVRTNVDVVIKNNRIARISPHSDVRKPNRTYVDASDQTVIPGLWESHTHEFIEGKYYGDKLGRLWMTYGVTSLQSVGDPVYRATETREAFAAGARVGPRFFSTGEAIDGERVFYNFMRPTLDDAGLALELSRAKALEYDMVKTYVRLPHAMQQQAAAFAHDEMGVFTGSHYMYPGVAYGMDGQTHVSATTRLGFAYTRSSGGISYRDVRDTYRLPGRYVISTTFNASLYAEDPTMVDDTRLQTLNPPWDELALRAKRDAAVSTDQSVSLDSLQKEEDTVRDIRRGGGVVLAGTDSPLDNVATALHLNLRAQVKYGLAPWEALQSVTILTARQFGVGKDLGSVEPGKLADLTFVAGNPLENIRDLANVRAVMKDGRLYPVEELLAPFVRPTATNATIPAEGAASARPAARLNRILPPLSKPATEKYWWHDLSEWNGDECGKQH